MASGGSCEYGVVVGLFMFGGKLRVLKWRKLGDLNRDLRRVVRLVLWFG